MPLPNAPSEERSPEQTVVLELLLLRGGRVRKDVLHQDFVLWVTRYGLPSKEGIEQWHRDAEWELTFARKVYDQQFAAADAE